ncbi:HNH endonuclease [Candidatus Poriferisodalis sp.]|uniref:HNH endonuclease signature motif containing protein n=1 Tax=Candidatus Poriferisodalis sp. TaxID=3101277 RepID=UPI003B59C247
MFSQVQSALDSLAAAFDGVEGAPTGELRDALGLAKPLRARLEALETAVASQIASREKHGDGGAGVLHQVAAVPRSDAARNVRTAAELEQLPDARSALAGGEMCMANASRLARVARQTSPEAVQDDPELMDLAKTLPPDEFAQASARWAAKHQSAASLADQHRRNRRNRNVRFWNGDDGTVQMRGAFDAEMGARIQTRIRDEAERLRQADRRLQRRGSAASTDGPDTGHTGTASDGPAAGGVVRTRDQRMADALDGILTHRTPVPAALPDCAAGYDTVTDRTAAGDGASGDLSCGNIGAGCCHKACDSTGSAGRKAQATQIIVRADLADLLDDHDGIGEIAGTGPVPASVIDRLCCNADISVVLFGKELTPLYEAVAARAPTAAQRRALIARDGACIGCGAPPGDCEAHHIIPWLCGGPTKIDNLVLVCWSCHDKIHDHNWQVIKRNNRYRLIPPDAESAPNPARSKKPTPRRNPAPLQYTAPTHTFDVSREPALFP